MKTTLNRYLSATMLTALLLTACSDNATDSQGNEPIIEVLPTIILNPDTSNDRSTITTPSFLGDLESSVTTVHIEIVDEDGNVIASIDASVDLEQNEWAYKASVLGDGKYVAIISYINNAEETVKIIKDAFEIDTTSVFGTNTIASTFVTTPIFSGEIEEDIVSVQVEVFDDQNNSLDLSLAALDMDVLTWSLTLKELSEGIYNIVLTQEDDLGNSAISEVYSFEIDHTLLLDIDSKLKSNNPVQYTGEVDSDVVSIFITIKDEMGTTVIAAVEAVVDTDAGTWSYNASTDLIAGNYTLFATAQDSAKNIRDVNDTFVLVTAFPVCNAPLAIGSTYHFNDVDYEVVNKTSLFALVDDMKNGDVNVSSISKVCTTQVSSMAYLFDKYTEFNSSIENFDTSYVTNMGYMFRETTFNRTLNNFDTSRVKSMGIMFRDTPFNQSLDSFDVSLVTKFNYMFAGASEFNQSVSHFDTSAATTMTAMFAGAQSFDQPVNNFDTSKVASMAQMFSGASSFNQSLTDFNTSKVGSMYTMFSGAKKFNQDLSTFDTSSVTHMGRMFQNAIAFNQDISAFNTDIVENMVSMFAGATSFDQNISNWNVDKVTSYSNFDSGTSTSWEASEKPMFSIIVIN